MSIFEPTFQQPNAESGDWLAARLKKDAANMPVASAALGRRINAAVEREAASVMTSPRQRPSRLARWLPAVASLGAAATLAAILLIPAQAPVEPVPGMSPAVRLASLVPDTDREQIAAEGRELAARVQQPLEQELAAVDAVINEFSEVMSRDFGPLAKLATRRVKPSQDDAS